MFYKKICVMNYKIQKLFFINETEIKLSIHRSLSNKFRDFILRIGSLLKKKITLFYLDDGFYFFKNSSIPQFIHWKQSIKILKNFSNKYLDKIEPNSKIYVSRQNTNYRSIVNESELIHMLKKRGFIIVNPNNHTIWQQWKIFAGADTIISPIGSNLTNIIFCKQGAKIIEIGPQLKKSLQEKKYIKKANFLELKYSKIVADTVAVDRHSPEALKYINGKILEESAYYKNLIVKISDIEKFLTNN